VCGVYKKIWPTNDDVFFKFLVFANFVLNDILLLVRKIDIEFLNLENVAFILVLRIKQIPNPIVL
jgi:hypothetical protein